MSAGGKDLSGKEKKKQRKRSSERKKKREGLLLIMGWGPTRTFGWGEAEKKQVFYRVAAPQGERLRRHGTERLAPVMQTADIGKRPVGVLGRGVSLRGTHPVHAQGNEKGQFPVGAGKKGKTESNWGGNPSSGRGYFG